MTHFYIFTHNFTNSRRWVGISPFIKSHIRRRLRYKYLYIVPYFFCSVKNYYWTNASFFSLYRFFFFLFLNIVWHISIHMEIFWIPLSHLRYKDFFEMITVEKQHPFVVFTPNPEILLITKKDSEYADMLRKADFLLPDGVGLYLAYQILDSKKSLLWDICSLPMYIYRLLRQKKALYERYGERICGSDLTKDVLQFAAKNKKEITVVDLYNPKDAAKIASQQVFVEKVQAAFPWLVIRYYIWKEEQKEDIIAQIKKTWEQFLFSTLGMKRQEENIAEIMSQCPNVVFGIGVGGSFDYFTGLQKRAPESIRRLWFEWLYRLIYWPQKIKRIQRLWNAIVVFTYEVLKEKARKKSTV